MTIAGNGCCSFIAVCNHICDLGVLSAGVNCVPHDLSLLFVHVDRVNIFSVLYFKIVYVCRVGKKINLTINNQTMGKLASY